MSCFDFASYLRGRLPESLLSKATFRVTVLTGGLVNHTVRVSFDPPISPTFPLVCGDHDGQETASRKLTIETVVLKHAPPHVATDPSQPLPVTRQLLEKTALKILNGDIEDSEWAEWTKDHGLERMIRRGTVTIPKLVWHDEEKNVLWIEDLGKTKTLSEVLLADFDANAETRRTVQLERNGKELGTFVAEMFRVTANPPETLLTYMSSLFDPSVTFDFLADMTRDQLKGAGVDDAEVSLLEERVRREMKERDAEGVCLGMVDFWSESVLIQPEDTGMERSCGLVDWEYFGVSSAASELGIFLGHLHVHLLNSANSTIVKNRIHGFTTAMYKAYADSAGVDWKPSPSFKRRFLTSHGRELVNGTTWYSAKLDESSKRTVLRAGLRSLRAAGSSDDAIDLISLKAGNIADANGDAAARTENEMIREVWVALEALRFE